MLTHPCIVMNNNIELLHQGDDIVISNEFNFTDSIFDLTETEIPSLNDEFSTVANLINLKFNTFQNLLKLAHINARSIPKHVHEIEKFFLIP